MPQRHRPELSELVMGEPLVGYRHSARTYGTGRVCTHQGCATRLSMYNAGNLCAVHGSFRSAAADATLRIVSDAPDLDQSPEGRGPVPERSTSPRTGVRRVAHDPSREPSTHLAAS